MKELTENFCKEVIEKRGYIFVKLYKHNDFRIVTFKDDNNYYYETSIDFKTDEYKNKINQWIV